MMAKDGLGRFWQIYLTHWTLMVVAIYLTAAAAATAWAQYAGRGGAVGGAGEKSKPQDDPAPWCGVAVQI